VPVDVFRRRPVHPKLVDESISSATNCVRVVVRKSRDHAVVVDRDVFRVVDGEAGVGLPRLRGVAGDLAVVEDYVVLHVDPVRLMYDHAVDPVPVADVVGELHPAGNVAVAIAGNIYAAAVYYEVLQAAAVVLSCDVHLILQASRGKGENLGESLRGYLYPLPPHLFQILRVVVV
jgi:hypothetical protein